MSGVMENFAQHTGIMTRALALMSGFSRNFVPASRLMKSPIAAYNFFRGAKPSNRLGTFHTGPLTFVAREEDWTGVREIFAEGEYEFLDSFLQDIDSPLVLDLGANIGGFALRAFRRWPQARVVSVEAAPDTFKILMQNRLLNPNLDWRVVEAGIWKSDGELILHRRSKSIGHRVAEGQEGERVRALTLQSLLDDVGWTDISLIKMDIEGSEAVVVPTISAILARASVLIIEVHTNQFDPAETYRTLARIYSHCWQVNDRASKKPLLVLSNMNLRLAGTGPTEISLNVEV